MFSKVKEKESVISNFKMYYYPDIHYLECGKYGFLNKVMYTKYGYCYLIWFADIGCTIRELNMVADKLGSCPMVDTVLRLLNHIVGSCRKIRIPSFSGNTLLHLDSKNDKMMELYMVKSMYRDCRYHIGGDNSIPLNIMPLMVKKAGLEYENEVRKIVTKDFMNPDSVLSLAMRESVINDAKKMMDPENKADSMTIAYKLTANEEAALIEIFPELNLNFSHKIFHTHAYAAASRQIEEQINIMSLGINTRTAPIPDGYDCLVKDSGGDPFKLIIRTRKNFHSCSPILSAYDQQREANRINSIMTFTNPNNKQKKILEAYNNDRKNGTCIFSCDKVSEQCSVKAPFMIFTHSTYDRTTTDIANAMTAANAKVATGSFIFDPMILVEREGIIEPLKAHFKIVVENDEKHIIMGFKGDSSWNYKHRLTTYMSLMMKPVIVDSNGHHYFVNIMSQRNSVIFFKITKSPTKDLIAGQIHHNIWFDNFDYVIVQSYTWE